MFDNLYRCLARLEPEADTSVITVCDLMFVTTVDPVVAVPVSDLVMSIPAVVSVLVCAVTERPEMFRASTKSFICSETPSIVSGNHPHPLQMTPDYPEPKVYLSPVV